MESVIKWRTGEPAPHRLLYVVTDIFGYVDIDIWDGEDWMSYNKDEVIAWCPLNEIEPYKE